MLRIPCLLLALVVYTAGLAASQAPAVAALAEGEVHAVLGFGPWPPPARPDPGNRVSGKASAIELGRRLFRDPRMSPVGYIACVTCHQPDRAFTDGKARAHGIADLPRNTPALVNLRQQRWYGWGGNSDSLWLASIRPMLDPREFDGNPALVARLFARDPELAACYRSVFQVSPLRDVRRTVVHVGKALAAWQETLVSGRTPFDEFRDALVRGDAASAATYPAPARRGLQLFTGVGACATCHTGPNFSDGEFHPGAPVAGRAGAGVASVPGDSGRLEGARILRADPLNLLGAANDDPGRGNATATRRLVVHESLRGRFRTPGLRNVAVTPPYMHDGGIDSLRDAAQHAAPAGAFSSQQVDDLVAFLATLTDRFGERRPWDTVEARDCR
jgi:cytochrome c peroxidase